MKKLLFCIFLMSGIWSCKKETINPGNTTTPPIVNSKDTVAVVGIGKENNNGYYYYKVIFTLKDTVGGNLIHSTEHIGKLNNTSDLVYDCQNDVNYEMNWRVKKVLIPLKNIPKSGSFYTEATFYKSSDSLNFIHQGGSGGWSNIIFIENKDKIFLKDTMQASFGGTCIGL